MRWNMHGTLQRRLGTEALPRRHSPLKVSPLKAVLFAPRLGSRQEDIGSLAVTTHTTRGSSRELALAGSGGGGGPWAAAAAASQMAASALIAAGTAPRRYAMLPGGAPATGGAWPVQELAGARHVARWRLCKPVLSGA